MLGHAMFQTCILLWLTLSSSGNMFFGIEKNGSREHYTVIFNVFVWLNIFNKLNCRKINDEWNIFEGFNDSVMGHYILAVIVIGQFIMVQFGGDWCQTVPLGSRKFILCIGLGSLSLPIGLLLRCFNFSLSKTLRKTTSGKSK